MKDHHLSVSLAAGPVQRIGLSAFQMAIEDVCPDHDAVPSLIQQHEDIPTWTYSLSLLRSE
jgi:hypothetical protein